MLNRKMKILVVDDFATMRSIIKNILKQLGFTDIDEAEDGAVALAKIQNARFGLVITDWNMPSVGGLDLLRFIRSNPVLKDIPVLMVTAEATKENVVLAVKEGVSGYIVKPFNAQTLKEKLDKVFA